MRTVPDCLHLTMRKEQGLAESLWHSYLAEQDEALRPHLIFGPIGEGGLAYRLNVLSYTGDNVVLDFVRVE